jgi:hypothetical protein
MGERGWPDQNGVGARLARRESAGLVAAGIHPFRLLTAPARVRRFVIGAPFDSARIAAHNFCNERDLRATAVAPRF